MADIVKDLRELTKQSVYDTPTIRSAADEIERLRKFEVIVNQFDKAIGSAGGEDDLRNAGVYGWCGIRE